MNIHTERDVGDVIVICGKAYKIISIHLYESEDKHTERYYLGGGIWFTQKFDKKRSKATW